MSERIHLDANAGIPLSAAVRDAVVAALPLAANASGVHAEGRAARGVLEAARACVAAAVGAVPRNVVFTSGATEAAALALSPQILDGAAEIAVEQVLVGATEHPCVLAGGRFPPQAVTPLAVTADGRVDFTDLARRGEAHRHGARPFLVALMLANNETGIVHPVAEAARIVKAHGGYVFCDAAQALGRLPLDITALGVDFLSLSAHKIGGPQGAGALVLRDEALRPAPLLRGGGQEQRLRAGTENVAAIAGFGVAAESADHHLRDAPRLAALRTRLEQAVLAVSPESTIVGAETDRLPNTVLFTTPGMLAETAVIAFDLQGIAVSAGAACSSGKVTASHVLTAMGAPPEVARSGIRVSLPPSATLADVEAFEEAWRGIHRQLRPSRAA